MDLDIQDVINEAIVHELIIADLYMIFYRIFPEDSDFWWALLMEEKNHAALIEGLRLSLTDIEDFPMNVIYEHHGMLVRMNKKIRELIQIYTSHPPSRDEAFRVALETELSPAENHFQSIMSNTYPDEMVKIVQQINRNDKNHALRIQIYMNEKGIQG
ncbi:MAG: rubrerythrin family protein [Proteobacteria bacterium]|nr:rubrerythrin family protein [Pseudomonadota bacterium]